jgi:hypothetical protein
MPTVNTIRVSCLKKMYFYVVIEFLQEHIKYANVRTLHNLFIRICTVMYTYRTYTGDARLSRLF